MAGEVEKSDEELRQEGREEVLEWLRQHEIVNYSRPENLYFYINRFNDSYIVLPWQRQDVE